MAEPQAPSPTPPPEYCLVEPWPFSAADLGEAADIICQPGQEQQARLEPGEGPIRFVYALVAPFATVTDEISWQALEAVWSGETQTEVREILISQASAKALESILPASGPTVRLSDHEPQAEDIQPGARTWAILPFGEIRPEWKVIAIGGQNPVQKTFNAEAWPLTVHFGIEEDLAQAQLLQRLPLTNRDPDLFATVLLTGVTALVRATAVGMDEYGVLAPAAVVGDTLREADLLHISNEVPFKADCPPHTTGLYYRFCSPDRYLELLQDIGTDLVELTGDHFQDYGDEAMLHTLELYRAQNWPYYGGGANLDEARRPLKLELKGSKIAFLGCNGKDPSFAYASETQSGAYHCDMDYMQKTIRELKREGYLPIVTFQHEERYHWLPNAYMLRDFRLAAEAGAAIVSGSQAHQPQDYEFRKGAFIHYGLGNLFFDQYGMGDYTDKAFLDRHYFYAGRYLGVELLTVKWTDYITPRWTSPAERTHMLETLFLTSAQIID